VFPEACVLQHHGSTAECGPKCSTVPTWEHKPIVINMVKMKVVTLCYLKYIFVYNSASRLQLNKNMSRIYGKKGLNKAPFRDQTFYSSPFSDLLSIFSFLKKKSNWFNPLTRSPSINRIRSYPRNRPWRPIGLWDVEDPTLCRQSAHRWRQGCQPCAPAALYFPEILLFFCFWYSFLLEAEWTPGPNAAGRIR
jgi:hypothetical protein